MQNDIFLLDPETNYLKYL